MKKTQIQLIAVITAVVFLGALLLIVFTNNSSNSNHKKKETISLETQPILGEKDAPVSIIEFGDFKCPSCKYWTDEIFPKLDKEYIQKGEASFSFINVLFHGEESYLGSAAAEAVLALYPEDYWKFHEGLFQEQPTKDHDSAWLTEEKVVEVAAKTIKNFNLEAFSKKINEQSVKDAVQLDNDLVQKIKVEQTPTIYINGMKVNDPFDMKEIKKLMKEK